MTLSLCTDPAWSRFLSGTKPTSADLRQLDKLLRQPALTLTLFHGSPAPRDKLLTEGVRPASLRSRRFLTSRLGCSYWSPLPMLAFSFAKSLAPPNATITILAADFCPNDLLPVLTAIATSTLAPDLPHGPRLARNSSRPTSPKTNPCDDLPHVSLRKMETMALRSTLSHTVFPYWTLAGFDRTIDNFSC